MNAKRNTKLIDVILSQYYYRTELYRYMPKSIFDALETAYLAGNEIALVPECDFIKMVHEIILSNGIQSN